MSTPALLTPTREQWLQERRTCLGASDVAAVLGVDPRRGPLAVYAAKVGDVESDETPWMRWGRRVEGAIADGYADETGRPVSDLGAHHLHHHPDIPWLAATLDRVTCGSRQTPAPVPGCDAPDQSPRSVLAPLECKAVGFQKRQDWEDDPPLPFVVQVQIQMACTGAAWSSLCALIGGLTIAWKDVLRDDAFLAAALPQLEQFWWHVEHKVPPPADGLPGTSAAVRKLWADEDGETVALNDPAVLDLVDQWERAKVAQSTAEIDADRLGNELRARLGSATYGALLDGSFLTLKTQKRGAHTVKASEFRVLRRWYPKGHHLSGGK